jgi:hypothetical protein
MRCRESDQTMSVSSASEKTMERDSLARSSSTKIATNKKCKPARRCHSEVHRAKGHLPAQHWHRTARLRDCIATQEHIARKFLAISFEHVIFPFGEKTVRAVRLRVRVFPYKLTAKRPANPSPTGKKFFKCVAGAGLTHCQQRAAREMAAMTRTGRGNRAILRSRAVSRYMGTIVCATLEESIWL